MSVKCRKIKLSEDVLRRHYDMLFEITRYFIDNYLRNYQSSGIPFMLITDLYESLRISSRAGDKILDRLEQCWEYIACSRSRKYRIACFPTMVGFAALLRRPEYREKLLKLYKDDPKVIKFLNPLNLLVSSFKDESELKELLNNVHNAVTSSSGFLRTIVKISMGPHVDDELVDSLVMFLQDLFLHESPQIPQITKVAPLLRTLLDFVILAGTAYFLAEFSSKILSKLLNFQINLNVQSETLQ